MALIAETLSPISRMVSGRGPMKMKAALFNPFRKIRIFSQETVTGMDRNRIGNFGGRDDGRHVEVTFGSRRRSDANGLIGHCHVFQIAVDRRVQRHGLDSHGMAGAQDAQCDLTAVGNDNFFEDSHFRALPNHEQRLIEFDRLAVFNQDRDHGSGGFCFDLVEHFHGLDDAHGLTLRDLLAQRYKWFDLRAG